MNGDPVEVLADSLEQLEDTVNVIRSATPEPTVEAVKAEIVAVAERWYEHPEAYFPRVVVYVREKKAYFELLKDGQATGPWPKSPEGKFDFWIIDTDRMADLGMSRVG